ncbi:MAG TPA: hypothetical protein VND65_14965 [Candidatus Binatia bacterium]|nr:hypothetical protein [Candidatus Binatia bacterium]
MYAGMRAGGQLAPYAGSLGDVKIQMQQQLLADKVLKIWKEERKNELRKYKRTIGTLRRVSDGINEWIEDKGLLTQAQLAKIEEEFNERASIANEMLKGLVEDYRQRMLKAGVTTALGYNFFDLRGPAFLIYPVNTPIRNSLPRWGKVNAGYGTAVHWKYTYLTPGTSYAGAAEGKRVAAATPPEADAIATYAELGIERSVTFTAEFAGEGYTDNVADEHLRGAHELWLQEESLMWGGNPGTAAGLNGFALGTANTPTVALKATLPTGPAGLVTDGGSGFSGGGTNVSVRVVELTMLGYPNNGQYGYQAAPTVTSGLTTSFTRNNADNTTDTIKGGMGAISAASNVVSASTSYPYVLADVTPKKGAFAWAWFVDTTDASTPSAANAQLVAITTVPFIYLANGTPNASYVGTAAGLSSDNSAQTLDFAGIIAWCVNNGTFVNMSDLTSKSPISGLTNTGLLTPGMTNSSSSVPAVAEIELDLKNQWNTFQTVADELWASADAKLSIAQALFKNTSGVPAYRFEVMRDAQGNILGGFVVSGYKNQYSMKVTGSEEIPIHIHPQLPPGTIIYRKTTNPYPHSRIPGVAGMFVQRDYYGIEWPVVTRAWTFGTYVHEVYGDYIPGLLTIRTGIIGSQ